MILVNLVILYKLDDSGNFKEYGDFGESADSSEPHHSGDLGILVNLVILWF